MIEPTTGRRFHVSSGVVDRRVAAPEGHETGVATRIDTEAAATRSRLLG